MFTMTSNISTDPSMFTVREVKAQMDRKEGRKEQVRLNLVTYIDVYTCSG
jgi:hypothetical protein